MQAYELQLERLKQALCIESDTAFSQILGVSQGSVSGAKKRGQIPFAWFFQVSERTNVSIDWLFSGHGAMQKADETAYASKKTQHVENIEHSSCTRCEKLEQKLEKIEAQRDSLVDETRQLWKENAALREKCARYEERLECEATEPSMGHAKSA